MGKRWKTKTNVVPVVVGALGSISEVEGTLRAKSKLPVDHYHCQGSACHNQVSTAKRKLGRIGAPIFPYTLRLLFIEFQFKNTRVFVSSYR